MTQKKTSGNSTKKNVVQKHATGIGFGLTAAAATVAGAYFLYGSKHAAQNRKKVKSWTLKAKAEVLEALEKAEQLTEEEYGELVNGASAVYGTVKNATRGEVADFKKEMLTHWKDLKKSVAVKKLVAAPKKVVRKKAATRKAPVAKKTT